MKRFYLSMLFLLSISTAYANDFPGRDIYPQVPFIELKDAYEQRENIIFIDARSSFEYETLRINNAMLIPLSLSTSLFKKKMTALRDEFPGKKLVFYCNGHNCMKSYKAARRSIVYLGQGNVFSFDAGIFDWATQHPEETLLLGKALTDSTKLLSKNKFKQHLLPAETFIKKADAKSIVLDIRDRIERDGFYIFSGHENSVSLNEKDKVKLAAVLKRVKKENKTLYVYDMVGKQVKWFQYYVESEGIKDYYFMEGGAQAFFDIPIGNLMD